MFNKYYLSFIVILLCCYSTNCDYEAAPKKYCIKSSECMDEQICHVKQCICKPRYVSNGLYCFPEAKHDEQCYFDVQCLDHRENCVQTSTNMKKCQCDNFHEFDSTAEHCVPKRNITDMLIEKYPNQDVIEEQAQSTYSIILICGLTLAAVGALFLSVALIYCFHMHVSDTKLNKDVDALAAKLGKTNSTKRGLSDEDKKRLTDAAVVPIIDDNMIIGDF